MSYNLSHTQFHYVRKFVLTHQLLKSPHLLMESGAVVVSFLYSFILFVISFAYEL